MSEYGNDLPKLRTGCRADNIYNRNRGKNIKDLSRSIVPKYKTKTGAQSSTPVEEGIQTVRIPATRPKTPHQSKYSPEISRKKANFDIYLNKKTSHLKSGFFRATSQLNKPDYTTATKNHINYTHLSPQPSQQRNFILLESKNARERPDIHLTTASPPTSDASNQSSLDISDNRFSGSNIYNNSSDTNQPNLSRTTSDTSEVSDSSDITVVSQLTDVTSSDSDINLPGNVLITATNSTKFLPKSNIKHTGVFSRMPSQDSGYGPSKSIEKCDSLDVSEVEAEYYQKYPEEVQGHDSPPTFPLYINKLGGLLSQKRNFEAFLKSEFKYVFITSGKDLLLLQ